MVLLLLILGAAAQKFVGGYLLLNKLDQLKTLADSAATLPVTRIWISFFSPVLTYEKGSASLCYSGLNVSSTGDCGFAAVKTYINTIQSRGVEVFLSLGGWNFNCFPYLYARYSVGGYGTSTPNFWKIEKYGGGSINNCVESNQFCYVCEPPSEGTSLSDFVIFPEPSYSQTWKQAISYVEATAGGSRPEWHPEMNPGQRWTDPKTGISVTVPGSNRFSLKQRDPYQDFVQLAADLGAAGLDLDYEEMWHADYHKVGQGPWTLHQTAYKYAAIAQDLILNIRAIAPSLKLSTAASATGAWSGNWWGGNLKGVWLLVNQWYKPIIDFMTTGPNAGGINVMTYDLSNNPTYHECPSDNICELDQQVAFYMSTYQQAAIPANVGYEIGTPAYPDPTQDPGHQLPLTKAKLQAIQSTQAAFQGGFFWELFKPANSPDRASATEAAQTICNTLLPGHPRCQGSIPAF